jgi:hypothetical protein
MHVRASGGGCPLTMGGVARMEGARDANGMQASLVRRSLRTPESAPPTLVHTQTGRVRHTPQLQWPIIAGLRGPQRIPSPWPARRPETFRERTRKEKVRFRDQLCIDHTSN